MAGTVRIIGPEYTDPVSREAFSRIEDSLRQYTTHARDTILVARNPLSPGQDHFVIAWPKGVAVAMLVHQGGRIRGGFEGYWSAEQKNGDRALTFENPLPIVSSARQDLIHLLQTSLLQRREAVSVRTEVDAEVVEEANPADGVKSTENFSECTRAIVLVTKPSERIRIHEIEENREFAVLTLDQAVARTIFHQPNLLRSIDFESHFFTPEDLSRIGDVLEAEAESQVVRRPTLAQRQGHAFRRRGNRRAYILTAVVLAIALIGAIFLVAGDNPIEDPSQTAIDSAAVTKPKDRPLSSVLLILPTETQAFISDKQYASSAELVRGIGAGEGIRLLPNKEQIIRMDSTRFARGVYGYFKADGVWRKGKLLQTLRARDTIMIENFLPPLS